MVARSKSLTYDDLQRLRETRDERLELIDGELIVTPSPSPMHQRVSSRLHRLLEQFIIDARIRRVFDAPLDVYLAVDTVLQPDLIVLLKDRGATCDRIAMWKVHPVWSWRSSRRRLAVSTTD